MFRWMNSKIITKLFTESKSLVRIGIFCIRSGEVIPSWRHPAFAKIIGFSLMVIASAIITSGSSYALTPQEIFSTSERSVLALEVFDKKGGLISAHSAILLDSDQAVTQCDLLNGDTTLKLRIGDNSYSAKPIFKDFSRNLCTLRISEYSSSSQIKTSDLDPQVGAKVYAISNALGLGISISEGVVSGVRQINGEILIQFTAPIAPGSEGGGLFDNNGILIGLINYQQRDGQNVNFAFPARWLNNIDQRIAIVDAATAWRDKTHTLQREENWTELAALAGKWTESLPDSVEAWLLLAFAQVKLKKWPDVEKACRQVLKRDPNNQRGKGLLASALLGLEKGQEALDMARSLLEYRKEDGGTWVFIAYFELALGHIDEAKASFERAIQLEPWNINANSALAQLARRSNDWNLAIISQRNIVRFYPDNIDAWMRLADDYIISDRAERALNCTEKILEIAPANADAMLLRGRSLHLLKRHKEATESFKAGLARNPAVPALGWKWLGDIYYELKLFPEAIAAFREAVKLDPKKPSYRAELAIALKDARNFDEALAFFEQLKEEDPKDPFPWRQLGFVNAFLAQDEKATLYLEKSLSLSPNQPKVWTALMEVYHRVGRRDEVKRAYQKLKMLDRTWSDIAYKRLLLPFGDMP